MTPTTLFYLLIAIIVIDFLLDKYLDYLNAKNFNNPIPKTLADVYDADAYKKSQAYKKENYKFSSLTGWFTFILTLAFFFFEGFAWLNRWVKTITDNEIYSTLLFFGVIFIGLDLITTPFSYYKTFVIEEKYGFNKTTRKLFFMDKIKGWLLTVIIGGSIMALIVWFYQKTGPDFWLYTWIFIAGFSLFMTLFYSTLIVPLFNKQTPLEDGALKTALNQFAKKAGFNLDKIFVIDGSKRSTKANAYFTGFGSKKRIVLYDTLINDLEIEEIVAVLAHEVGHYKKKHVIFNIIISILTTGFTLFLLSLFIDNELLANALSVKQPSFHIGLIAFGVLYSPISALTGLAMNYVSRKFEYQADAFAAKNYKTTPLITGLKKLSKNSLSNLTPHPWYVFMHYSHPTLLKRVTALEKI